MHRPMTVEKSPINECNGNFNWYNDLVYKMHCVIEFGIKREKVNDDQAPLCD